MGDLGDVGICRQGAQEQSLLLHRGSGLALPIWTGWALYHTHLSNSSSVVLNRLEIESCLHPRHHQLQQVLFSFA